MMSKNSLMRSSSRSAFSRAMPVYLARISGEKEGQVADDAGQGRFQVVGQIDD